jgi:hypothetical protein
MMHMTRDDLIERLDLALDRELVTLMATALNAEAHGPDPATRWRALGAELHACAQLANRLAQSTD